MSVEAGGRRTAVSGAGGEGGRREGGSGEGACGPVDLDHLARQTFGSSDLADEVLHLFLASAGDLAERVADEDPVVRAAAAHRLKGAARAIGAFGVAGIAERLEEAGLDAADRTRGLADLAEGLAAVAAFVAARG